MKGERKKEQKETEEWNKNRRLTPNKNKIMNNGKTRSGILFPIG